MLDVTSFNPLLLAFHNLAGLWAFVRSFFQEDADVKPPRPEPAPDDWAEARFAALQDARAEDGDVNNTAPPDWLDQRKLARARELHLQHWPCINNAQVISLFLSFSFAENSKPLVYTRRSDTAPRARRRYLETALHVHSWALGDVWRPGDTAYENADRVRAMHRTVARQLEGRDLSKVDLPVDPPPPPGRCPVTALRRDLGPPPAAAAPAAPACPARFLSQSDMVYTQWYFVGLIVLHPEKFGLGHLTDDDLECFLHHWRSVGHRLGVAERHNLCAGSLRQVRALCHKLKWHVLVPKLWHPDPAWHGLTRALYDGLGSVFTVCHHDVWMYYILHDVLGLKTPHMFGTLGWADRVRYRLLRAIYRHANHYPEMHAAIRTRARAEFLQGAQAEKLAPHLTYVFDLI